MVSVSAKIVPNTSNEPCRKRVVPSVSIRYYRLSDDLGLMRDMFAQSNLHGPDSPFVVAMGLFAPHRAFAHGLFSMGLACLIMLSTKPRWISRFPILESGRSIFIFWTTAAVTLMSAVATIWCWRYRHKIRHVFRVYIEDAHEKDFQDITKKFGMVVRDGSSDTFPRGSSCFWVAEEGGKTIGFVGLDGDVGEKGVAEVRRLVVAPSHQRRGVGRKLMDAVVKHARENDINTLELTTSDYNIGALCLYKLGGWRVTTKTRYEGIFLNVLRKDL